MTSPRHLIFRWIKLILGGIRDFGLSAFGWAVYRFRKVTPPWAHQAMIRLFCRTGGWSNDVCSKAISIFHGPYRLQSFSGVLGNLSPDELQRIVANIDRDGYHVFETKLSETLCNRLLDFAVKTPCFVRPTSKERSAVRETCETLYDRKNPVAVRYDYPEEVVIGNGEVQDLLADLSIIGIAQAYLRAKPIADVVAMWWHTPFGGEPDPEAAQFWHFDMDRIKWLKFFFYLTDVDPNNGPHSFVAGSHRAGGIPKKLRGKGYMRLTDEEVEACYAPERFIVFNAPRGTVIAEDTRGLHKGNHVLHGDRLMLQLQFSNSLFGGYYPPVSFNRMSIALEQVAEHYPHVFSNYIDRGAANRVGKQKK